MSDDNVSAEDARGMVGPWYPSVDGAAACFQVPRLARSLIAALGELAAEREASAAALEGMGAAVVERDEARAEVDRLRADNANAAEIIQMLEEDVSGAGQ
jgi:hypothetical protein